MKRCNCSLPCSVAAALAAAGWLVQLKLMLATGSQLKPGWRELTGQTAVCLLINCGRAAKATGRELIWTYNDVAADLTHFSPASASDSDLAGASHTALSGQYLE